MKPLILLATQSLLIAGLGFSQTVFADSTRANCEFTKSGDRVNNASGDCTFSQRRGNISITLRNGDNYELRAGNGNYYTDQNGNNVERREERGGVTQYKWNNKNIRVSFNDGNNHDNSGSHNGSDDHGKTGQNVRGLQDLVGINANAGDNELERRGYKYKNGSSPGNSGNNGNNGNNGKPSYVNWKNRDSGQCIAVRTEKGKIRSLVYATDYDCKNG